jgi:hypothetical protein
MRDELGTRTQGHIAVANVVKPAALGRLADFNLQLMGGCQRLASGDYYRQRPASGRTHSAIFTWGKSDAINARRGGTALGVT